MILYTEALTRLLLAALLGSVIGFERQRHTSTAGLRTHMMVCLGATLFMLVSCYGFQDVVGKQGVALDPSRVAAQVVSGIGFLGAGTILFLKNQILKGLTTAAGLWTVAAIGLAVGGGLYVEAVSTTMIALIILFAIKPLESRFLLRKTANRIGVIFGKGKSNLEIIREILVAEKADFFEISLSLHQEQEDRVVIDLDKEISADALVKITDKIQKLPDVIEVKLSK